MIMIPAWVNGALVPVEKLAAHKDGLRHKAISVFLMRGGRLLLQRRALGKYHTPGLWANTCCTHPSWDEPPMDCAARRLGEELGIESIPLHHRGTVEYRADVGGGLIEHEVVEMYVGWAPEGMTIAPNPEEVMDTQWMDLNDLRQALRVSPEQFTPWLRIYMAEHAEMIFAPETV